MSEFNRKIKEAMLQHESPVDTNQLWMDLQRKKKKRRYFILLWFAGIATALTALYWCMGLCSNEKSSPLLEHQTYKDSIAEICMDTLSDLQWSNQTFEPLQIKTLAKLNHSENAAQLIPESGNILIKTNLKNSAITLQKDKLEADTFGNISQSNAFKQPKKAIVYHSQNDRFVADHQTNLHDTVTKINSEAVISNAGQTISTNSRSDKENIRTEFDKITMKSSSNVTESIDKLTDSLKHSDEKIKFDESSGDSTSRIKSNLALDRNVDIIKDPTVTSGKEGHKNWQLNFSIGVQQINRRTVLTDDTNRIQSILPKVAFQMQCDAERSLWHGLAWNVSLRYEHLVCSQVDEIYNKEVVNKPNGWTYEYVDINGITTKKMADQKFVRISTLVSKTYQRIRLLDFSVGLNYKRSIKQWEGLVQYQLAYNVVCSGSGIFYQQNVNAIKFSDILKRNVGFSSQYTLGLRYNLNTKSAVGLSFNHLDYHESFNRNDLVKDYFSLNGVQLSYCIKL